MAAEVLQCVEAKSTMDVESYICALGNIRYAALKESLRMALLYRARAKSGVEVIDVAIFS